MGALSSFIPLHTALFVLPILAGCVERPVLQGRMCDPAGECPSGLACDRGAWTCVDPAESPSWHDAGGVAAVTDAGAGGQDPNPPGERSMGGGVSVSTPDPGDAAQIVGDAERDATPPDQGWSDAGEQDGGEGGDAAPRCSPGVPCDDGDPCTHGDRCDGAEACTGTAVICASDACTARECNGTPTCTESSIGAAVYEFYDAGWDYGRTQGSLVFRTVIGDRPLYLLAAPAVPDKMLSNDSAEANTCDWCACSIDCAYLNTGRTIDVASSPGAGPVPLYRWVDSTGSIQHRAAIASPGGAWNMDTPLGFVCPP